MEGLKNGGYHNSCNKIFKICFNFLDEIYEPYDCPATQFCPLFWGPQNFSFGKIKLC